MKSFLKVKIKSLAAEAHIIRREERRALTAARWGKDHQKADEAEALLSEYSQLRVHRTGVVRDAARVSQLAYGFLRGRAYVEIEQARTAPEGIRNQAANLAVKYGSTNKDAVLAWFAP